MPNNQVNLKRSASVSTKSCKQTSQPKQTNPASLNENTQLNDSNKKLKTSLSKQELNSNDYMCPICLEILIEPVVLPCNHELCLPCFKAMTNITNLLCPMCRMRISTWARSAANSNNLVNQEKWQYIQKNFPIEVKNRVEGKTAQLLAESIEKQKKGIECESSKRLMDVQINCSKPGEIRNEYLDLLKKEQERIRIEKENEEKLSLEFIEKLIRQENQVSLNDYVAHMRDVRGQIQQELQTRINTNNATNLSNLQRLSEFVNRNAPNSAQIQPLRSTQSNLVIPATTNVLNLPQPSTSNRLSVNDSTNTTTASTSLNASASDTSHSFETPAPLVNTANNQRIPVKRARSSKKRTIEQTTPELTPQQEINGDKTGSTVTLSSSSSTSSASSNDKKQRSPYRTRSFRTKIPKSEQRSTNLTSNSVVFATPTLTTTTNTITNTATNSSVIEIDSANQQSTTTTTTTTTQQRRNGRTKVKQTHL